MYTLDKRKSLTISGTGIVNGNIGVGSGAIHVVLMIDRSGSMDGKEYGIMSGSKKFIDALQKSGRVVFLTIVLFDDTITRVCSGQDVRNVPSLNYKNGGSTAALDALGHSMEYIDEWKSKPNNKYAYCDTLHCFISDGQENSSKKFDIGQIQGMMAQRQQDTKNGRSHFCWLPEFNVDVEQIIGGIPIDDKATQTFIPCKEGYDVMYKSICLAADDVCRKGEIGIDWVEHTDKLEIGGTTVKELKIMLDKYKVFFKDSEDRINALEKLAYQEGLSSVFTTEYASCKNEFIRCIGSVGEATSNIVNEVIGDYIEARKIQFRKIMEIAAITEAGKRLNANDNALVLIRAVYNEEVAKLIWENIMKIETIIKQINIKKVFELQQRNLKQSIELTRIGNKNGIASTQKLLMYNKIPVKPTKSGIDKLEVL